MVPVVSMNSPPSSSLLVLQADLQGSHNAYMPLEDASTTLRDAAEGFNSSGPELTGKVTFASNTLFHLPPSDGSNTQQRVSSKTGYKNLVLLIHIIFTSSECCGAVIGSSGKFCIVEKHKCTIKSHKQVPLGWINSSTQGMQAALFMEGRCTAAGNATPFQLPILCADHIPPQQAC
ncbi:hypothetical protein ACA910_008725 [Epithemia clementina (nom. ined.)]